MKRIFFVLLIAYGFLPIAISQTIATPDKIYGKLFSDVQMSHIFPDNKTFVDCIPKRDPAAIVRDYLAIKNNPAIKFSLEMFVRENFIIPSPPQSGFQDTTKDVVKHINNLWEVLKRQNDSAIKGSSLLPLPYPYIVPGGRFHEIYYWDSYFTMLGLRESGQDQLIENMIRNFAHLINTYGHIPNGNRTYYLSRSQPPFFSLMVNLLAEIKGEAVLKEYLPAMQKEHDYWMDKTAPTKHVARMPDGSILNRYYDQLNIPRQESHAPDVETAEKGGKVNKELFRDLRSSAESGWDFSTRWFADEKNLTTIRTTSLVPVDLNCLLYALERNLSKAYDLNGDSQKAQRFNQLAESRKKAINKYCWSAKSGWYVDYNLATKRHAPALTLAGVAPFFLQVAPASNIFIAAQNIRTKFLQAGGVTTTLVHSGEQWDAPNGWAPLEWMAISGLELYSQHDLAKTVAERWVQLNVSIFKRTGKLMEKYNVYETNLEGGGGEYPSQDGFGWTNGVLLALIKKYGIKY
ncbi:alpha,alpha-trehalase TreA [Chitinophagaceae bacterium LB-8]|uniref:Alpha,alpha-trehalase TreA n=1 Tax=Paraflavisolibacter caeni TaxID=2982496 RepID=A0A9X2XZD7_9BACT|nr:alpha,alpha-trehalase TreA [Paraflavisolibacter caeni]MCU7552030.1 alpha,alpha-trehalase TreA [Paraflavisolibacter caeni]